MREMRIFYASDFHGSEPCFKKFVNAARFYDISALVLGGDLAGKAILPIVDQGHGECTAVFLGKNHVLRSSEEVEELEQNARNVGMYPKRVAPDEASTLAEDPGALDDAFAEAVASFFQRWFEFVEDRLPEGIECYVMPGNDDPPAVEEALTKGGRVCNPDGKKVVVGGVYEMISLGYSNRTPFDSPRELDDEELGRRIETLADEVAHPETSIFNIHCPPYASSLDLAPEVDENLRMKMHMGRPQMIPVGSKAVRGVIEKHQPLLGLHGHCHESRGIAQIGRTICLNPGSEYTNGILRGVIVTMPKKKARVRYQFVSA